MPAFDPVRDAVLNSPVESRVTSSHSLAVILNDDSDRPSSRPSPHTLAHAEPIRRSSMDLNYFSSSSAIPYNPKVRITPPGSVLTPLSLAEIDKYKTFRGQGVSRLTKRKRSASEETDERPVKRHAGDVGVVVEHCEYPLTFLVYQCSSIVLPDNSRPDVGIVQRLESPIIGLKNFNNWVKSILITRFAHPVLAKSSISGSLAGSSRARIARGKVLDMGCGKGGDITKWAKAHVKELFCVGRCLAT